LAADVEDVELIIVELHVLSEHGWGLLDEGEADVGLDVGGAADFKAAGLQAHLIVYW
jgi:hypothetical protein